MAIYANYIYVTYFHRVFHNFPDSVAKPMKRALFYTNYMLEPKKALKNYKEAIFAAQEANMDPYSPEVLGMKIQVAAFMEKVHNYEQAILVLEDVRRHCLMWVEEKGAQHVTDGHRTRILGMTVGLAVKLGELYSMEWVGRQEEAEEVLVAATETVLKEKKRREAEGVKEGEGEWLDDEQIGGSVEGRSFICSERTSDFMLTSISPALAQLYSSKGNHALAAPLYLQALSLCPPKSCHAVILSRSTMFHRYSTDSNAP
jgi:tetratricopeptide (TPR) repeat protein